MENPTPDPELVICQALVGLVFALAFGPWLTVAGMRVLRDPSRVEEKTLINRVIKRSATRSALARGNIRFWAWMVLITGIGMDLIGVLALVAIVGAVVQALLSR